MNTETETVPDFEDAEEIPRLVSLARSVAEHAHAGQFRRDGVTPYITHPVAVARRLRGEAPEVIAAAWLHDVLEDTAETPESLLAAGVSPRVVEAVAVLTKNGKGDYPEYLKRVKADEIARKVKVADMLANLSDSPTDKQILKYARGLLALLE